MPELVPATWYTAELLRAASRKGKNASKYLKNSSPMTAREKGVWLSVWGRAAVRSEVTFNQHAHSHEGILLHPATLPAGRLQHQQQRLHHRVRDLQCVLPFHLAQQALEEGGVAGGWGMVAGRLTCSVAQSSDSRSESCCLLAPET